MKKPVALLILLLILSLLASCVGPGDTSSGSSPSQTVSEADNESVGETVYKANLPDGLNYGDEEFVILSAYGGIANVIYPFFGGNGEYDSSVVNDAVLQRNMTVEDLLGVKIVEDMIGDSDPYGNGTFYQTVSNAVDGGVFSFQFASGSLYNVAKLSASGYLTDLMSLEYLNGLNGEWWNKNFRDEMNIAGSVYFATGDISFGDTAGVFCLVYNKKVLENNGLGNLYDLVRAGTWDYDTFITYGAKILEEIDNDGTYTYKDKIGIVGQSSMLWALLYAGGERIAANGTDGYPELTINAERSVNLITEVVDYLGDRSHLCSGNDYFNISSTPMTLIEENFKNDMSLFYGTSVGTIPRALSDMKSDFGVLPYPKYDLEQENYYSLVSPWTGVATMIPFGMSDDMTDMAAAVVEAMAAEGKNFVTGAYIDTTLKNQKTRDDDSRDMLDIIIRSAGCDLGQMFQWGNFSRTLQTMLGNSDSDFTSKYESAKGSATSEIEKIVNTYKELNGR